MKTKVDRTPGHKECGVLTAMISASCCHLPAWSRGLDFLKYSMDCRSRGIDDDNRVSLGLLFTCYTLHGQPLLSLVRRKQRRTQSWRTPHRHLSARCVFILRQTLWKKILIRIIPKIIIWRRNPAPSASQAHAQCRQHNRDFCRCHNLLPNFTEKRLAVGAIAEATEQPR